MNKLNREPLPDAERSSGRAFRHSPGTRKGQAGSSLVEFAYVAPFLIMLFLALVVFTVALSHYLTLTNATTVGAQRLAASRGQTTDPCATTVSAVEAAAPNLTASSFTFYFAYNGGSLTKETSCGTQTLVEGQSAEVEVTYPCNLTIMPVIDFNPSSCTMTAQATEDIQ